MSIIAEPDVVKAASGCGSHTVLSEAEWRSIVGSLDLSKRQFQIAQAIFDGAKEITIAESLGISTHTVHTHIERLYHKLGVGNRCELIIRIFAEHFALRPA